MNVRTYSSGSVTDSHRIPFSIRALLLIPTIRYSKLGAKIVYFGDIHKFISFFFQLLCLLALLFLDLLHTFIEGRSTYSTNEAV